MYRESVRLEFTRRGGIRICLSGGRFSRRPALFAPLRQECLNAHWFLSLEDAKQKIEAWRRYYNEERLHSARAWMTPAEFARLCGKSDLQEKT